MKQGGNAYKLFEVLRERDAQTAAKAQKQPPAETKKFTPVEPNSVAPRPTLLLGGIGEKQAQNKPVAPAASQALTQPSAAPLAEVRSAKQPLQPGRGVIGHYRGKALVVKYDVAMVVTLFMMGLLVIAFVWGYSAGKSVGRKDAQAWQEKAAVATAVVTPENPAEKTAKPAARRPDDGEGIYCLQLMTSTRAGIEELVSALKDKGYPNVAGKPDPASSKWVLYLGRFKTKQSAEEYKKYLVGEEHAYEDGLALPRP